MKMALSFKRYNVKRTRLILEQRVRILKQIASFRRVFKYPDIEDGIFFNPSRKIKIIGNMLCHVQFVQMEIFLAQVIHLFF